MFLPYYKFSNRGFSGGGKSKTLYLKHIIYLNINAQLAR